MLVKNIVIFTILVLFSINIPASCRNPAIKHKFDVQNGYKYGRKGYVVDHICALSCGGLDITTNMQYQTIADSKLKDKWETTGYGCRKTCNSTNSFPKRTVFNCK